MGMLEKRHVLCYSAGAGHFLQPSNTFLKSKIIVKIGSIIVITMTKSTAAATIVTRAAPLTW